MSIIPRSEENETVTLQNKVQSEEAKVQENINQIPEENIIQIREEVETNQIQEENPNPQEQENANEFEEELIIQKEEENPPEQIENIPEVVFTKDDEPVKEFENPSLDENEIKVADSAVMQEEAVEEITPENKGITEFLQLFESHS